MRFAHLLVFATLGACSSSESADSSHSAETVADAGPPAAAPALSPNLHWFRNSAERIAIYRQTYRFAAATMRENATNHKGDKWGVVLDVDETVLDNSQYQKERGPLPYDAAAWTAWVNRKEAKALPGAVDFVAEVKRLGGTVAFVTNRNQVECSDSEANLKAEGFAYDIILCKSETSDKNPRFNALAAGTAPSTIAPFEIVLFVGDSITDFPNSTQDLRTADPAGFASFGTRFFALPNPMYGGWQGNAQL